MMDNEMPEKFKQEIELLKTLRHRNIIFFVGCGVRRSDGNAFLVTEFAGRGSLRECLENPELVLTSADRVSFALDACQGMAFLHSLKPIRLHRDLKSDNLLVTTNFTVKISGQAPSL